MKLKCPILVRIGYKFGKAGGVQNLVFIGDTSSERHMVRPYQEFY